MHNTSALCVYYYSVKDLHLIIDTHLSTLKIQDPKTCGIRGIRSSEII